MDFEELANRLNDDDREWWPFLFMRPAKRERMTSVRVLALAALYGLFAGFMANAFIAVLERARAMPHPLVFPLAATAILFVLLRTTLAVAWNRRAARLARKPQVE